ncbi:MAG TPA: hypothetical protein VGK48_11235 [Terriglobia bacterium]|jgi:hypothetical protein
MRGSLFLTAAVAVLLGVALAAPNAQAQVSVGVGIGAAPVCPYGYYDVAPYNCAPYGYYGPEWFDNGAFLGVGPWFHGSEHFRGHVNNHFHPEHGYKGPYPNHGERASKSVTRIEHFKGNEMRDGHGHVMHK